VDAGEYGQMMSPDDIPAMPAVLALQNGKFHRADCPMIAHIKPRYMREFASDLDAFDHGYQPALYCSTKAHNVLKCSINEHMRLAAAERNNDEQSGHYH
jgi:hypothetical protein